MKYRMMAGKLVATRPKLGPRFLDEVTHDLRGQLCGVVGYADLMLMGIQGPLTEPQLKSLKAIVEGGNDLTLLLDNLRELIRLETGKPPFVRAHVVLPDAARAVLEQFAFKAAKRGVALDCSGVPEDVTVWGDEFALRRVLANLVSNALKATPKGGKVSLSWSRTEKGEDRISVQDTGPGIPEAKRAGLFRGAPRSADGARKPGDGKGLGLGLAICKGIMEGLGGRIWAESGDPAGAAFLLTLPPAPAGD